MAQHFSGGAGRFDRGIEVMRHVIEKFGSAIAPPHSTIQLLLAQKKPGGEI
jgi:hypothetical protein